MSVKEGKLIHIKFLQKEYYRNRKYSEFRFRKFVGQFSLLFGFSIDKQITTC